MRRRIGLAVAFVVFAALPGYSEPSGWDPPDMEVVQAAGAAALEFRDGKPGLRFIKFDGVQYQMVWQPLSDNACREAAWEQIKYVMEMPNHPKYKTSDWAPTCTQSDLFKTLTNWYVDYIYQWQAYCQWRARDYEAFKQGQRHLTARARPRGVGDILSEQVPAGGGAGGSEVPQSPPAIPSGGAGGSLAQTQAAEAQQQPPAAPDKGAERESKLMAGSRASMVEPYTSQRIPNSGGAGGSQLQRAAIPNSGGAGGSEQATWESQPACNWSAAPAVPNSGGAGGSEAASVQSQPAAIPSSGGAGGSEKAPQAPQQVCLNDPKSFGDAQLRLLLADPKIHARLTTLIAEEPSSRKAKTEKNQRPKRVRAPTDADNPTPARSNPGMSPEAASALGTMIDVGMNIGLSNAARRGTHNAAPNAAPARGTHDAAPRRGTYDAAPR